MVVALLLSNKTQKKQKQKHQKHKTEEEGWTEAVCRSPYRI